MVVLHSYVNVYQSVFYGGCSSHAAPCRRSWHTLGERRGELLDLLEP